MPVDFGWCPVVREGRVPGITVPITAHSRGTIKGTKRLVHALAGNQNKPRSNLCTPQAFCGTMQVTTTRFKRSRKADMPSTFARRHGSSAWQVHQGSQRSLLTRGGGQSTDKRNQIKPKVPNRDRQTPEETLRPAMKEKPSVAVQPSTGVGRHGDDCLIFPSGAKSRGKEG